MQTAGYNGARTVFRNPVKLFVHGYLNENLTTISLHCREVQSKTTAEYFVRTFETVCMGDLG